MTQQLKRCSRCQESLPLERFSGDVSKKDGRHTICRFCQSNRFRQRTYGVSFEQFTEMWRGQNGQCAICSQELRMGQKGHALDHNHDTGEVRGLLCNTCNRALGLFQDSPDTLQAALTHLTTKGSYGPQALEGAPAP